MIGDLRKEWSGEERRGGGGKTAW